MKCILVIFGGTGDLANRKLYPAIHNLRIFGKLPDEFALVSVGRREKTHDSFRDEAKQAIIKFSRENSETRTDASETVSRFFYFKQDFSDMENYCSINLFLSQLDLEFGTQGNRIYYLATAPSNFLPILKGIAGCGMNQSQHNSWQRVMIEKPFGSDFASANDINSFMQNVFGEENIYRIDHYLGKEMLQNIMAIRFANSIFEPIWSNKHIDHIQITSAETVGVENRAGYYENSGALRDMMQNHMLQLLMLTAMDAPEKIDPSSIRKNKLNILKFLRAVNEETIDNEVVRAQYGEGILHGAKVRAYRQEAGVSPVSGTETYMAMKVHIDTERWSGVPFYLRTGKRMPFKTTEIAVVFKKTVVPTGLEVPEHLSSNTLVIKVQPQEAVVIWINGKKPGSISEIIPISMGFCQNCSSGEVSSDAYERLLLDAIRGDSTLFAGWEEVEYSWKFIDAIAELWKNQDAEIPYYDSGTWGPAAADSLLQNEGRHWNEYIWRCFNYEVIRCVNANT